jgi:hypothetical protein
VLITTKSGKEGKAQISFDAYYGVQTVARKINMLNAKEWLSRLQSGKVGQSVTLFFGKDANGNTVITEGREGFWSKKAA